ncbi:hypothetical protein SAMD00019534_009740 [Acytostelium subglobosum LB1]|uniref:hypothetical protein n=1 Tax=Acytostelium subglobosum LB1 TaxID=1410327 RepID=UPI000644AD8A|nr:hypothetical protein SAMD00019534_009740 [Acytostelium subglobosum LB1]GAM17799.1 hypothetical protein SAMD00019534_009740 [Acytostelium subglobosum LB1]|eukprot:XP_012758395.1 hypothetical protein SAMD00019534_009740 [Acytostelium subglobosum LB1]
MKANTQHLPDLESILLAFKPYFPTQNDLLHRLFSPEIYLSNAATAYRDPIAQWLEPLFCLCKYQYPKHLCLVQQQTSLFGNLYPSLRHFVQLVMLCKMLNRGSFPQLLETDDIKNLLFLSTGHAHIIPFLMDGVLKSTPRCVFFEHLCKFSDSLEPIIVGYHYHLPSTIPPISLSRLTAHHWYYRLKSAAWRGDLESLTRIMNLQKQEQHTSLDQSIMDELVGIAIVNERTNILKYLVDICCTEVSKENMEYVGTSIASNYC